MPEYILNVNFLSSDRKNQTNAEHTQAVKAATATEPLAVKIRVYSKANDALKLVESLRLGPQSLTIGAGKDADLVIEDAAVSRAHLQVTLVPGGVQVRDLGSRNGTFYLGQKIGELTLQLGSRIRLGESELEFLADREDFEGTQSINLEHYGALYGAAPVMKRLFTLMQRLEGSLVNVLIEGESGTGKELIARALHEHSLVGDGPFVAINCGALDRSLVRSELFGHKKGAFTGAQTEHSGAFGEADGGTLFLDEIGELPLDIQPILLRVLESGSYTRVGETRARPVKVRVIAATHRNLKADVDEGLFRADLYYRLMVVQLAAPALRERREDIPLLAQQIAKTLAMPPLSETLLLELNQRAFPGNVRELKHALMAYSAVGEFPNTAEKPPETRDSISQFIDASRPYAEQKEALIDHMTQLYLKELIQNTQGNRSEAARVAELQRGYLRRLLQKYGLDADGDDS